MNYTTLDRFIQDGRKPERKIKHKTYATRGCDQDGSEYVAIRYHRTEVVRFYADGRTRFDSGGWLTPTTKDRMNLADNYRIWQEKGYWFVSRDRANAPTHRFSDGMTFTQRGRLMNGPEPGQVERTMKREEKLRKRIRRFANAAAADLAKSARPATNRGDCWYCALRSTNEEAGTPLGDATDNHEHLTEHMDDDYCPTALFINAMEETKQHPAGMAYDMNAMEREDGTWMIGGPRTHTQNIADGIYRYMVRRLIPDKVLPGGSRPAGVRHTTGTSTGHH
jgi:hypothetical protein